MKTKHIIRNIHILIRRDLRIVVGLFIIILVTSFLEGIGIGVVLPLFDFIQNPNSQDKYKKVLEYLDLADAKRETIVAILAVVIMVVFVAKNLGRIGKTWLKNYFMFNLKMRWQREIFENYLSSPYHFFVVNSQGVLIQKLLDETKNSSNALNLLIEACVSFFTLIAIYAILMISSWKITTIFSLIAILIGAGTFYVTRRRSYVAGKRMVALEQESYFIANEVIAGMRQIKAFVVEKFFKRLFKEKVQALCRLQVRYSTLHQMPSPVVETIVICGVCIGLFFLAKNLNHFQEVFPLIALFVAASYRLMPLISNTSSYVMNIGQYIPSISIVAGLVSQTRTEEMNLKEYHGLSHDMGFRNITFRYPNTHNDVIKNVSFEIKKGAFNAVVGLSGAGKSTIADLLIKFYKPSGGEILVDGVDLQKYDSRSWRKKIGLVSQDTFIFNGTIKENIAFATDNLDSERIESVAKLANAHEFIINLADGYNTEVGERGLKLSGGQRQRIAIARALYRDPEIMIFDEATSSLDTKSEKEVQKAIENLGKKKTLIVIAHRLSTVVNADKIYVLQDGRIVEEGTHRSLLQKRGIYWELCKEQDLLLNS